MRKNQQGQVLPLGLAMLVLAMLGAFAVYNTGQIATHKTRLANVADAAAYSGALWQARALNFQAYTNRAMVANQVAIAQAVSLHSWATYGVVASGNLSRVLSAVPVINALTAGLATGMAAIHQVVKPVSDAIVRLSSSINRALSLAQQAFYLGTFAAIPDVVSAVVKQNDSRFTAISGFSALGMAESMARWRAFTTRYDKFDSVAMNERKEVIEASRDNFTRERNWRLGSLFFPPNLLIKQELVKEGQTRLTRYETPLGPKWEWKAKDTLSLHTRTRKWFGSARVEVPIGWAEAFANENASRFTLEGPGCGINPRAPKCSQYGNKNSVAEYAADLGIPSPVTPVSTNVAMSGYGGINAYNALSDAARKERDPRLQLKVEVAMPASTSDTTESMSIKGVFDTEPTAAVQQFSSVSVAEVYYQRPDFYQAGRSEKERANGYNPYWTPRLSAVSLSDRLTAFTMNQFARSSAIAEPSGLSNTKMPLGRQHGNPGYSSTNTQDDSRQHSQSKARSEKNSLTRYGPVVQKPLPAEGRER